MWTQQDSARQGQFLMAEVVSGWNLEVLTTTEDEVLQQVRQRAQGWSAVGVQWQRGVFGIGASLRVFGRADGPLATGVVAANVSEAVNSFWLIGGASARVSVSDELTVPTIDVQSEWAGAVQWAAAAVIVAALVFGIWQIRKAIQ